MKVRLTKPWGDHLQGVVLDPAPSVAVMLLAEGFAERVAPPKVETAEAAGGEMAATRVAKPKPKRRRRRRSKKVPPKPQPEAIQPPQTEPEAPLVAENIALEAPEA